MHAESESSAKWFLAVTPKVLGGPLIDGNRLNASPSLHQLKCVHEVSEESFYPQERTWKKLPGRLHTWKNQRKAGGGYSLTDVAEEFGINKSDVSRGWKALQTLGTAV
ncbi:hypothetical protein TNCV_4430241 [Trichonephila clavipes]|nr:hypothetical protein TNCV_4430241 [Trichonephila clavipes]